MGITAAKTFIAGEVLTAADLNKMNTNILNQQQLIGQPRTENFDMDRYRLILDQNGDTSMRADTADQIDIRGRRQRRADDNGYRCHVPRR